MAQLQPNTLLDLDWRSKDISHRELLGNLHLILTQFDDEGKSQIAHVTTNDRVVIAMHDATDQEPAMYRTSIRLTDRSLPSTEEEANRPTTRQKSAGSILYLTADLLNQVSSKVGFLKRRLWHETAFKEMGLSQGAVYKMFIEIAITVKVHPYRLGLKVEEQSQVFVPQKCKLNLSVVYDIFDYIDDKIGAEKSISYAGAEAYNIPTMITKLDIVSDGQVVRAVIVTERRNMKDVMFNMRGNEAWNDLRGVMVVMTDGFADYTVREFLCLLGKAPSLQKVPFLWLSDGDSDSIAQYLQCKYGSGPTAFASPTMVCPRLLFVGMQQSILDDFVDKYPDRQLGRRLKQDPTISQTDRTAIRDQYVAVAAAKKQQIMSQALTGNKKKAHQDRLKGIRNAGYLLNGRDLGVEAVVKVLEGGGAVLPLSCLSKLDTHSMLLVVRDAVLSALEEKPAEVPFVSHMDSLAQDFAQFGSQPYSQEAVPANPKAAQSTAVFQEEEFENFDELELEDVFV